MPCYAWTVAGQRNRKVIAATALAAAVGLLLAVAPAACHKQEQEVVGVAAHAAQNAEFKAQQAQAAATESASERSSLQHIPLPTKSLYVNVHEPGEWKNPFLSVDADRIDLRVTLTDANPSPIGAGGMTRPEAARRQELQIAQSDLAKALIALPDGAWRYGRVVAIAESPDATRKNRPIIRRNVEVAIQKLNDLGIVVEEWPAR